MVSSNNLGKGEWSGCLERKIGRLLLLLLDCGRLHLRCDRRHLRWRWRVCHTVCGSYLRWWKMNWFLRNGGWWLGVHWSRC